VSDAQTPYLNPGLPAPVTENDGLSTPYRDGLRDEVLRVQRCGSCGTQQFGPEWICHRCHSFDMKWEDVAPRGKIYSWSRCWHPVHPALNDQGPYLAVLVELPHASGVRMMGNLLGDPTQSVEIGDEVEGVFEHHRDNNPPFSLLQWRKTGGMK